MKKIIQIATNIDCLYALTEDGKVYSRAYKKEQICKNDPYKGETKWKETYYWKELPFEDSREYTEPQKLPF